MNHQIGCSLLGDLTLHQIVEKTEDKSIRLATNVVAHRAVKTGQPGSRGLARNGLS